MLHHTRDFHSKEKTTLEDIFKWSIRIPAEAGFDVRLIPYPHLQLVLVAMMMRTSLEKGSVPSEKEKMMKKQVLITNLKLLFK